jgi:phosphate transport system permease protein
MTLLGGILFLMISEGASRLSFSFPFTPTLGSGSEGGVFYQLTGTAILILTCALVAGPVGFAIGCTRYFLSAEGRLRAFLDSLLHVLAGIPSILFGIFGFIVFVKLFGWNKSWLGGGLVLALMALPTVTQGVIAKLDAIPVDVVNAAHALGFDREKILRTVLFPYGRAGLLTGLLMSLGRAMGETAPIMFTAAVYSGATLPGGVADSPVLALPYHIFNLSQDLNSDTARATAWATALVLVAVAALVTLVAAPFRYASHEEGRR